MARTNQGSSAIVGVPKTLRNRIVGSGSIDVAGVRKNAANWRKHPPDQIRALEDVPDQVGWIQNVIVNRTTGNLVDGHARVEIAEKRKEKTLPAVFVEISAEEEDLVVASLDPMLRARESGRREARGDPLARLSEGRGTPEDARRSRSGSPGEERIDGSSGSSLRGGAPGGA